MSATDPVDCTAPIISISAGAVQRIVLRMPDDFTFRAGQYLEVLHPEGPIPLSIASAPRRLPELHLHYRSTPGVAEATRMDELLASERSLNLRGPGGTVTLPQRLEAPALMVAGGTGIAQALSFIDAWAPEGAGAAVTLLWCADDEAEFYLREELEALQVSWLELVLVADPDRSAANRGMTWLRARAAELAGATGPIVLSGSPGFVYAACDVLDAAGVADQRIQSDVFAYAPR